MYVSISLLLFVVSIVTLIALRISRPAASYGWVAAAVGAVFGWASVFAWQLSLPQRLQPSLWAPVSLFGSSPNLLVDAYGWLYALSLAALAAAVVLTAPARSSASGGSLTWAGAFLLTALSMLAVLADNPLTLVLAWTAIDISEFLNTLRASKTPENSERSVISFSIRAAGTGLVLWASVISAQNGQAFLFENATQQTGLLLLVASGLRLGVLPLHLTFRNEPVMRRGFGTMLRMSIAAASLILLARLPFAAVDGAYVPALLFFILLAALYGGWKWLSAPDELSGRPFWIIGMSALSMAATLRGSPAGSAAWGAAMILFGGISFLYSARQVWFTRILVVLSSLLLCLPFSLTASGWSGAFRWPLLFLPLFLLAHLLLVAGYLRQLLRPSEIAFGQLPVWAQTAYPFGLGLLVLSILVLGVWGWPGALQVGVWPVTLALWGLLGLLALLAWRLRQRLDLKDFVFPLPVGPGLSRLADLQDFLARVLWFVYRNLGRLFGYAASLLEGDGGLLWTLLLLVLLLTALRGS